MTYLAFFFHSDSLSSSSVFRSLAAAVSIALIIGCMAPAAQAQPTAPSSDDAPRWTQTFEQQVGNLLDASATEEMQARGMQLVIKFSDQSGSSFNFDTVRPELYDILFNYNNPDDLRILALSALNATGAPRTQVLAESVQDEPSPRVQRFMLLTLQSVQ